MKTRWRVFLDAIIIEGSLIKNRFKDKKLLFSFSRLLVVVAVLLLLSLLASYLYVNPEKLLFLVKSAEAFGPLIIIGFIVLEVVLAPLPGFVIMVAAGYLYGPLLGALYSYIGNVLGSIIAFLLAKRFGRPFVERIVSKNLLVKYDAFFTRRKKWFVLFYALPIVPVDILSFICGLSALRLRKFVLIIMLGFIPNTLLLAFFGDVLSGLSFFLSLFYVLLFLIIFSLLAWLFRLIVKRFTNKNY